MNKIPTTLLVACLSVSIILLCVGWGSKSRTTDELMRIAGAGGGFTLDAGSKSLEDLIKIAAASEYGKATVHIKNCGSFETLDLIKIAAAGGGHVDFDL